MDYYWVNDTTFCEIPNGWMKTLVPNMCKEVNEVLVRNNIDNYEILQAKEKFGSIRVYDWVESNTRTDFREEIDNIYRKYEKLSRKTCIKCGNPSNRTFRGVPLCKNCFIK